MSSVSTPPSPLLVHLESLFGVAQMLTLDAERAARLVEGTYQRAFTVPEDERPAAEHQRTWLLQLMREIREERAQAETAASPDAQPARDAPVLPTATPGDLFRRRLAEQLVDRVLPAAIAELTDRERLVVLLMEVEGLSPEEVVPVVGIPEEEVEPCRKASVQRLQQVVGAAMSPAERAMIAGVLPEFWLREALHRLAGAELSAAPASLRASVLEASQHTVSKPDPEKGGPPHVVVPIPPFVHRHARWLIPMVIIVVAGSLGLLTSMLFHRETDRNVISLSANQVEQIDVTFETNDVRMAEKFVLDRLKWRLRVPQIEQANLRGVSLQEITNGITVPVFVYTDVLTRQGITVYSYNYALLDRFEDRLIISPDVLDQIQDDGRFDLYDLGDDKVLIWRSRDEIFVAVTHLDPEVLRDRIAIAP